jgi:hypothetical protein
MKFIYIFLAAIIIIGLILLVVYVLIPLTTPSAIQSTPEVGTPQVRTPTTPEVGTPQVRSPPPRVPNENLWRPYDSAYDFSMYSTITGNLAGWTAGETVPNKNACMFACEDRPGCIAISMTADNKCWLKDMEGPIRACSNRPCYLRRRVSG